MRTHETEALAHAPTVHAPRTHAFTHAHTQLTLVRINPRAMREKEKKLGATYINLADYVSPDPLGVNAEVCARAQRPNHTPTPDAQPLTPTRWNRV